MNIVTKADGSLLKVGTSLATSTACCCATCFTPQTCGCLPSTLSINIPAWTYGVYSCAAQTVVAYKCCFNYPFGAQSRPAIVYRINPILVGIYTASASGAPFGTNAYFEYWIVYGLTGSSPYYCIFKYHGMIRASKYSSTIGGFCYPTVRNNLASNPCGGLSNDVLCSSFGVTNNFYPFYSSSMWGSIADCVDCFIGPEPSVRLSAVTELDVLTSTSCTVPTSTPIKFDGVNAVNITVS